MKAEDRYDSLFAYYGAKYGVDRQLLKAQAKAESALNPDAVSNKLAQGLSQFVSRTWAEWRDGTPGVQPLPRGMDFVLLDPRDPEDAIRAQSAMMAWLLKQFDGNVNYALAGYNFGIGNVKNGRAWPNETKNYIARIKRYLAAM